MASAWDEVASAASKTHSKGYWRAHHDRERSESVCANKPPATGRLLYVTEEPVISSDDFPIKTTEVILWTTKMFGGFND